MRLFCGALAMQCYARWHNFLSNFLFVCANRIEMGWDREKIYALKIIVIVIIRRTELGKEISRKNCQMIILFGLLSMNLCLYIL